MDRRRFSLSLFCSAALAACGGGGSAVGDAPQAGAVAMLSRPPVAAWGDSHTSGFATSPGAVGYATLLAGTAPGRQIFNGGAAGETSTQIAQRRVRDSTHRGWTSVFWYGGNNQWEPDAIEADIARSVGSLEPGNVRYLVLSVLNQSVEQERRGGWLHARRRRASEPGWRWPGRADRPAGPGGARLVRARGGVTYHPRHAPVLAHEVRTRRSLHR